MTTRSETCSILLLEAFYADHSQVSIHKHYFSDTVFSILVIVPLKNARSMPFTFSIDVRTMNCSATMIVVLNQICMPHLHPLPQLINELPQNRSEPRNNKVARVKPQNVTILQTIRFLKCQLILGLEKIYCQSRSNGMRLSGLGSTPDC